MQPTPEQIDAYRRDGFLVVERFLDADEVERLRERFAAASRHEWETGLAPDEVNYDPGVTPPDRTRQLCNVVEGRSHARATMLAGATARSPRRSPASPGLRLLQDNVIWKPPSGKALLCHQDAAYIGWLAPKNMTTCWIALDDTAPTRARSTTSAARTTGRARALGGAVPRARRLARLPPRVVPAGTELELVPIEVPAGGARLPRRLDLPRLARRTSAPTRERRSIISPHRHDRHALERRRSRTRLQPLPAAGRARARRGVLPGHVARRRPPDAVIDPEFAPDPIAA